ncbi:MAG: cell division protein FtsA [Candidatus Nomurabacteria bacterium]|nr:MAG: cell division protein FtsA [Candidatus Nomurabacteria bacterium]HRV75755.1 cell division protein FtsA [Candidatus Saccharimonadales bacterium]
MTNEREAKYYCGIDVGTNCVRCVIGRAADKPGELPHILGVGQAKTFGMRRGNVVDPVSVAQSIDSALAEAEKVAGVSVDGATFSINGQNVMTHNSKGASSIENNDHVSNSDVRQALDAASIVQLPANQRMLELIPVGFSVDGEDQTQDPVGMSGNRLEVEAVIISGAEAHLRTLEKAISTANINCNGLQSEVRAGAEAVLTREQRERGVIYIDIGAQTTSLAVFEETELRRIIVVPMGSAHITNDLAIGLQVEVDFAEKIKTENAAVGHGVDMGEIFSVEWDDEIHHFKARDVDMIVRARLEEIFEKLAKALKKMGQHSRLPSGIVLGGGGSAIEGIEEVAKDILKLPCKKAEISTYETSTGDILGFEWSAAVGLMLFDDREFNSLNNAGNGVLDQIFDRTKKILFKGKKR